MDLFESRKSLKSRSMDIMKRRISFFRSRLAGRNWLKAYSVDPRIYSERRKPSSIDPWIYLAPDSTLTHAGKPIPSRDRRPLHRHRQVQALPPAPRHAPKPHPRAPASTPHRPASLPAVPEPAARPADTAELSPAVPPAGSPRAAPRRSRVRAVGPAPSGSRRRLLRYDHTGVGHALDTCQ